MTRGRVVENAHWMMMSGRLGFDVRRLWVIDGFDEAVVYSDSPLARMVRLGDEVTWSGNRIFWTYRAESGRGVAIALNRVGTVHDPRGNELIKAV